MNKQVEISKVSVNTECVKGFCKYWITKDSHEIIMNIIKKGVQLNQHSHEFAQFGYCFEGDFLFKVDEKEYLIDEKMGYTLIPNVIHGAEFHKDMIAIDFKYAAQQPIKQKEAIVVTNLDKAIKKYEIDGIQISIIDGEVLNKSMTFSTQVTNYIILVRSGKVSLNNRGIYLEGCNIYELINCENKVIELSTNTKKEVILITMPTK